MRILGIESSGMVAGVALLEDDRLVGEYSINNKLTHSQTLLPMLDELRNLLDLDLRSLDAVAVSGGPGSFTGLRIGSATAKGLGLALDLPLIAVPTVEALAYNLWGCADDVCPIMDARREQVYTGIYRFSGDEMLTVKEPAATGIADLLEELEQNGRSVVFLGDGVPVYGAKIAESGLRCRFAPAHMNRQRAAALCVRAAQYFKEGRTQTADEHRPEYLRLSQAERERLEKERKAHQTAESGKETPQRNGD